MTTVFQEPKRGGDFLISYTSPQANMFSAKVSTSATGGDQSAEQIAGLPVLLDEDAGTAVLLGVADFATANGFLVHGDPFKDVAQNTELPELYSVVAKAGVAVNESVIPATDAEGTPIDAAAKAALRGATLLAGFTFRKESPTKETQET